jgi:hypothetical protein
MKFNKSITWQNLNKFDDSMRTPIDSFLLFYVIQYFQRRKILEIGFRQGYSFGLMLEASPHDAVLEAVDIVYPDFTVFDLLKTNKETKAMRGKLLNIMMIGPITLFNTLKRARSKPTKIPEVLPKKNPTKAS